MQNHGLKQQARASNAAGFRAICQVAACQVAKVRVATCLTLSHQQGSLQQHQQSVSDSFAHCDMLGTALSAKAKQAVPHDLRLVEGPVNMSENTKPTTVKKC